MASGRQRIETVVSWQGYTDRPDTEHAGWAQADHVRRYSRGSRRVTVAYDLRGRVLEIWTARQHVGPTGVDKANWVINYLRNA